uniref:DEP domain-containing protein 1B isoform X3 n=1 Tax=Geotrypetes seraphini TaxID=260995 RepID=A0A6P8QGM9_GEOSA|nr:DEP domain-containing protein 1B isoform X3 [Geotrypetes seraphini]
MEHKIIGPGPYRATKLWNEIIELFRAGMSLRKHRVHFRSYDKCFSASEAIEYLHDLLRCNQNFGPDVSHSQTIQLLKKFLKNHVIEDVKGRWGTEDFEDNGCLYRFPPSSPLKSYPKKPMYRSDPPKFPGWGDNEPEISREYIPMEPISMNSDLWYKRHSIAIGEVPACRLIHRRELLNADIEEIWKSTTLLHLQKILGLDSLNDVLDAKLVNPKHIMHSVYSTNKQGVVILEDKSEELPHWVLSAMKCLANWPNCSDLKQPMYVGFEKDVFKTVADYHSYLKEPLLTYQLFDAFVNVLENRRKLQLLMRMMARISLNKKMPSLSDRMGNRMLMVQTFSRCILCSKDEVDLDELLATRLVAFMMDNYLEILNIPYSLQTTVEEHVSHLHRVQIKYQGSDLDAVLSTQSYYTRTNTDNFEFQKPSRPEEKFATLLEEIIMDKKLSVKDKKKKLKQFQKSYPGIYKERFPTPESEAALFPEKPKLKPPLLFFALKKPFQPFQRTRSFRM